MAATATKPENKKSSYREQLEYRNQLVDELRQTHANAKKDEHDCYSAEDVGKMEKLTEDLREASAELKNYRKAADVSSSVKETLAAFDEQLKNEHDNGGRGGRRTPRPESRRDRRNAITWHSKAKYSHSPKRIITLTEKYGSDEYHKHSQAVLFGAQRKALLKGTDVQIMGQGCVPHSAIVEQTDATGGMWVPSERLAAGILHTLDDACKILQLAHQEFLETEESLGQVRRTQKASGWTWGKDLVDLTTRAVTMPKWGKREMTPQFATFWAQISKELLRRSTRSPEALLFQELGIHTDEFLEQVFLYGTGMASNNNICPVGVMVNSPYGITTARDVSSAAGLTTTFTYDTFLDMKYALKDAYRSHARWMIHRNFIGAIAKLRDLSGGAGTGQYLWQPAIRMGEPDILSGIPIDDSEWMPSTAGAGNYFALLADWRYYWVVWAKKMEISVWNEIMSRQNLVEYHMRMKLDAQPILEEAFVRGKFAAS